MATMEILEATGGNIRMSPYIADKSVIVLYYFLVDNLLGRKWTLEQSVDVGRYYRIFSMILPDGEIISV